MVGSVFMRCLLVSRTELGILRRSSQRRGHPAGRVGGRLPGRCTAMAFVVSCRDSFHQVIGCGAAAARAHGGDPQAGWSADAMAAARAAEASRQARLSITLRRPGR